MYSYMSKEDINVVFEAEVNNIKKSNVAIGATVGAAGGAVSGLVAASFIFATTGGTAFLVLGVAAVGAALGHELAAKLSDKEIKAENEKISKMTNEEAMQYKFKEICDIRKNIDSIRNKSNDSDVVSSISKITIIGS